MTTRLTSVLTTVDLPLAELCCARLDGEVYRLADSWCPIDEIDGCVTRARAAANLATPRAIVERHSAAWIYGLTPEPARHQFCVALGARTAMPSTTRVQLREVVLESADTNLIDGVRVTTPLRTAVDLARHTTESTPALLMLLRDLLRYGGYADAAPAIAHCQRSHAPYSTRAQTRLAALDLSGA